MLTGLSVPGVLGECMHLEDAERSWRNPEAVPQQLECALNTQVRGLCLEFWNVTTSMLFEIVRDLMLGMRDLGEEPVAVQSPRAHKQYPSDERDRVEEADRVGV